MLGMNAPACRRPAVLLAALLAIPASGVSAAPAPDSTPDPLTERLTACNVCHGERGEGMQGSEYYPHLAGKPAGYLLDQLQAFRDGRRQHMQMAWLVQHMDDRYMVDIARHFAAMPPRTHASDSVPPPPLDAALAQRAEALVQRGDPAAGVTACTACHGADLTGLEPGIPALVGLPAEYVVAQFGAWRTGVRRAREPDCMAHVAQALTPADVRIVATWLSQQSHADERRPAPAGSFVPPEACGSLPHTEVAP